MSVVANRPESASMPYTAIPHSHSYSDSVYGSSVPSIPSRTSSVSSFKTNYTASTIPTSYSPTFSGSYRTCDSAASLDKILESVFKRVPQEVYENILDQLQFLHSGPNQSGCMTCFQRDLHALSLTCRPWEKAVRSRLYNRIHIVGSDSPAQLKKYRLKRGSRLKLLRRTLRERKLLANLVLELRVPQIDLLFTTGKHTAQWQEYRDLIASVVMVCPNLERLLGLTIPFNHEFDRLTHALSTRRKLKEHTWILCEATETSEASPRSTSCPGSLGPLQMFEFLNYHASWTNLETLMLYGLDRTALEPSVFLRTIDLLPSLRNLCVSNFDADAFSDTALLCLPSLESLRLENLPGVTDAGLAQYTSRPESSTLKSLTLIEPNIDSLLVISKILASLQSLERFKIVQTEKCPTLNTDGIVFQPLLASSSLRFLHWDVACPNPSTALSRLDFAPFAKPLQHTEAPNSHLAQSILCGGFPRLDALRAPSDIEPPGALQAVCQPIPRGQALLQPDRYSLPRSSHGSVQTRPMALPGGNNLTSARIRAQTFIDMAARDTETGLQVLITDHSDSYVPDNALEGSDDEAENELDETGMWEIPQDRPKPNPIPEDHEGPITVFDFRMPAYMGRTGAKISERDISIPRFILRPDIVGQDADGGLVSWRHILAANQSFTFAAGVGVNCFGSKGVSSPTIEEPLSPTSTSTPRFGWGSIASITSTMATSPVTPTTPPTPMSMSTMSVPPWEKDVCTGSWNYSHKGGRDWWFHMERERPVKAELYDVKRLF
ncbi:hypothetical protein AN4237.2 [Aspergillus nidulans FGSC A4]|uniref:F-box domain-containing protein n=1 Tax=Emericella nidulans (strain FGSC A4 / ATCC 38163 / CBS 112.46 / NRRL 194 / M139) TaxID=227321 RepID=Q5B5E3_EMENI|nr:hypothetical protein [Aspergillus nidulans FGSC A4]EAA59336.1 hypothetical protein AN4237.2 [Aspergillus nidulans FGSC A4]CBF74419.1 TPA: conserved predicted protein (AFU_orthologue; AFUA_1G06160) [Aspergillus nidulans FGSC A4]|eukprot:XP_661841.1 hypothetical protein AN4237.2 [Aspergillus nidulans FGSC A4]